jgi:hypothetical protein
MVGDWKPFLRSAIREEELRDLREHGRTGRPLGSSAFVIENTSLRALEMVVAEEERRLRAAKLVQEIASCYPELFEKCARQFIESIDSPDTEESADATVRLLPGNEKLPPTEAIFRWLGLPISRGYRGIGAYLARSGTARAGSQC